MPRSRHYLTLFVLALALCVALCLIPDAPAGATPLAQRPGRTPTPPPPDILLTEGVADPGLPGVSWFAPTGHTLRGSFLDYWNERGGLPQFGYPITEEFTEPIGAVGAPIMVQYFERARFEHHPENAGTPYEVLLGALGREFHPQDPPASPLPSPDVFPPTRVYFGETGHNLGGAFLRYWNEHGALAVHGYPISEEFEEKSPTGGKTYKVQYFERSRFELHPENAGSPYEVLLGQVGTQLSQKKGYPYGWYPLYGYAADFSWVAGIPQWQEVRFDCNIAYAGYCDCITLRYEQAGTRLQLDTTRMPLGTLQRLRDATLQLDEPPRPQVVFGRFSLDDEKLVRCTPPVTAKGYLPQQTQNNPASVGEGR